MHIPSQLFRSVPSVDAIPVTGAGSPGRSPRRAASLLPAR